MNGWPLPLLNGEPVKAWKTASANPPFLWFEDDDGNRYLAPPSHLHGFGAVRFLHGHEAKVSRSREPRIQADLQEHASKAEEKLNVAKESMPVCEWHPGMDPPNRHEGRYHGMER